MTGPREQERKPGRLAALGDAGVLSPLSVQLAHTLGRLQAGQLPEVLLGVAFASRAVERGHVCADIWHLSRAPLLGKDERAASGLTLPDPQLWLEALRSSPLVSDGSEPRPLVLDDRGRLYLYRYFDYQRRLASALRTRLEVPRDIDSAALKGSLLRLFGPEDGVEVDLQRLAAVLGALWGSVVISGGPGTGKTTTVVKILALLAEQAEANDEELPQILLLAPTGKAAARLSESISAQQDRLPSSERIRDGLTLEASTIHRALGYQPRTPTRFRHGPSNPLVADIVLVDESSMVDLALMTKLVEAVRPGARLILLGDKDQLASVEAGAILGDIFNESADHRYSDEVVARVHELTALRLPKFGVKPGPQDCMVHLEKSFRYRADGGIGALSRAINSGHGARALELLQSGDDELGFEASALNSQDSLNQNLSGALIDGFAPVVAAIDPADKLSALSRFRILTAHRRGPWGAERLNELAEKCLAQAGKLPELAQALGSGPLRGPEQYENRPLMVTRNDYQLGLFNGDVGILARRDGGALRAYFQTTTGVRGVVPTRLPPHVTVFAMTVHKSQGSEFDRVALVLPDEPSPILSRELVYTAVTRAKLGVTVYAPPSTLAAAISARVERASGLPEAIWGEQPAGEALPPEAIPVTTDDPGHGPQAPPAAPPASDSEPERTPRARKPVPLQHGKKPDALPLPAPSETSPEPTRPRKRRPRPENLDQLKLPFD